jgi:hypothetical protein
VGGASAGGRVVPRAFVPLAVDAARGLARTRSELGARSDSDAAVVERALNAYVLGRLLDVTQERVGLCDDEAERLTYEELHAPRRERGAA